MQDFSAQMNRIGSIESQMYNPQQQQQYYQPQQQQYYQHQQQVSEIVEKSKEIVCKMLNDMYAENYKKIALNCIYDELTNILKLPLQAQDRMFFQKEQENLNNASQEPQQQQQQYKTAESLVNKKQHQGKNNKG